MAEMQCGKPWVTLSLDIIAGWLARSQPTVLAPSDTPAPVTDSQGSIFPGGDLITYHSI